MKSTLQDYQVPKTNKLSKVNCNKILMHLLKNWVNGLFKRAFVSSGVKVGWGGRGSSKIRVCSFSCLRLWKWDGYLNRFWMGMASLVLKLCSLFSKKNILKEYPTQEITTSRALLSIRNIIPFSRRRVELDIYPFFHYESKDYDPVGWHICKEVFWWCPCTPSHLKVRMPIV